MAAQTLAEAKKLINNEIIRGVAEDIIDVNPIFGSLPFIGYEGQAIVHNRENALGDASVLAVDAAITAVAPATFVQQTFSATKIIGDVEMDGLVQAQSSSANVDQLAIEISSKAKAVGREFQEGMAIGDGSTPNMNSVHSMVDAGQFTSTSAGQALTFELLDEGLDLV